MNLYGVRISARFEINIGNNVVIEESVIVDTDFHSLQADRRAHEHENLSTCRINVGNIVFIGARSIVMKGVTIGDSAIVGTGSVVSSSVKSGKIVLGNPAKPINDRIYQ